MNNEYLINRMEASDRRFEEQHLASISNNKKNLSLISAAMLQNLAVATTMPLILFLASKTKFCV